MKYFVSLENLHITYAVYSTVTENIVGCIARNVLCGIFATMAAGSHKTALFKVLENAPEVADDCSERLKREELF